MCRPADGGSPQSSIPQQSWRQHLAFLGGRIPIPCYARRRRASAVTLGPACSWSATVSSAGEPWASVRSRAMCDGHTVTKLPGDTMIDLRTFDSLGGADHGWLKAKHHFSFADYADPDRDRWGALRVWNDDEIAPSSGFPPHPHANMEIITYVRDGAISHRDSLGNEGRTVAGDVQVMSAGTGIRHAEYNLEPTPTRIFQIWIEPDRSGGAPAWGAKPFPKGDRSGRWVVLASGQEADADALPIRADARVL